MLIVTYNPNYGYGVADGGVEQMVTEIIQKKMTRVVVSNKSMVDEFRLRVCKGEINHNDITFKFKSEYIKVNEYGAISTKYPEGFCGPTLDRSTRLLQCAFDKRRTKRKENTK